MKKLIVNLAVLGCLASASGSVFATSGNQCALLPTNLYNQLKTALVAARKQANGGFNLDMWGTIVDRDGVVCAVAFTGADRGAQWPGSRVISAQKANTANAFSLKTLALSTANLYSAVQPGGSLFGLQESNPVNVAAAYAVRATTTAGATGSDTYGMANDPLVGQKIGGVNVFGGGLALYNASGALVGAIGVSGDSSCADHNIAWETRHGLGLDHVPGGVSGDPKRPDNIVYDLESDFNLSPSGWGHPLCAPGEAAIAANLPPIQ